MEQTWSKFVVSPELVTTINRRLNALLGESNSKCALLLHSSGQVVTSQGELPGRDLRILGTLLAGNFATAREIAKLLRDEEFKAVFQEGQTERIFTSLVGGYWMLSVVFGNTAQVGLVKVLCERTALELGAILLRSELAKEEQEMSLGDEFCESMHQAIDVLFREDGV